MPTPDADRAATLEELLAAGELEQAEQLCRARLREAESAPRLHELGNVLVRRGRLDEAAEAFERAIAVDPEQARSHNNLANVHLARGRTEQAIERYRAALALPGATPKTRANLARALLASGRRAEAIEAFEGALGADPGDVGLWTGLARALRGGGDPARARDVLREATRLFPGDPRLDAELGATHLDLGEADAATVHLERAHARRPDDGEVALHLALARENGCDLAGAQALFERARADPAHATAATIGLAGVLFELGEHLTAAQLLSGSAAGARGDERLRLASARLFHLDHVWERGDALLEAHRAWGDLVEGIHGAERETSPRFRQARRPKLGFLSQDLRQHVVPRFLRGLLDALAAHADVTLFSTTRRPDDLTAALGRRFSLVALGGASRDDARRAITAHDLDVLIELGGHTGDDLALLSPRLAPVQVLYLGYPGTSGLRALDFRITDAWVDPPGCDEPYSEASLRLARTAWAYEPPSFFPPTPPPRSEGLTFGCFNRLAKYGPRQLDLFAGVLRGASGSRLLLRARAFADARARERVLSALEARGVARERVEARAAVADLAEAQREYAEVDVALDTFPYQGTTTTCDALVAGRPVIALRGDQPASRVASSLLAAVGCDDLVATDEAAYVERAVVLGEDRSRRAELARELPRRVREGPLGDPRGLARSLMRALVEAAGGAWDQVDST